MNKNKSKQIIKDYLNSCEQLKSLLNDYEEMNIQDIGIDYISVKDEDMYITSQYEPKSIIMLRYCINSNEVITYSISGRNALYEDKLRKMRLKKIKQVA